MLKNDPGSHFSTGSLFNVTPANYRCCVAVFGGVLCCRICFYGFAVGVGAFLQTAEYSSVLLLL